MIGIYKITSPSGKVYVGQSVDVQERFAQYRGGHCKNQPKIFRSLNKYGIDNHTFEIIEECLEVQLNDKEIHWIAYYNSVNEGLNCQHGGLNGRHSEETKKKMSEWQMGIKKKPESIKKSANGHRGMKFTDDALKRMSEAQKGRTHSDETKKKMSENAAARSRKGKTFEEIYGVDKANDLKNRISKSSSKSLKGRQFSDEHKEKLGKIRRGKTYVEMYGEERAKEIVRMRKESINKKLNKQ